MRILNFRKSMVVMAAAAALAPAAVPVSASAQPTCEIEQMLICSRQYESGTPEWESCVEFRTAAFCPWW